MHSLCDAVSFGVVRGGVAGGDGVPPTEVLEVLTGKLASVVHDYVHRGAVVPHSATCVLRCFGCVWLSKGKT